MNNNKIYIFDFDSTLTSVEGLDVLADIIHADNPKKKEILAEMENITNLGIDGDISFAESLKRRIRLLQAKRSDLVKLIAELKKHFSPSIEKNKKFFEENTANIYVISAGFKEFIIPVVAELFIHPDKVFANTFEFDKEDNIIGFDKNNILSTHTGKIDCIRELNFTDSEVQMIGDGYSDYVTRKAGVADVFFAFTENITREKTIKDADYIVKSFDEILSINNK